MKLAIAFLTVSSVFGQVLVTDAETKAAWILQQAAKNYVMVSQVAKPDPITIPKYSPWVSTYLLQDLNTASAATPILQSMVVQVAPTIISPSVASNLLAVTQRQRVFSPSILTVTPLAPSLTAPSLAYPSVTLPKLNGISPLPSLGLYGIASLETIDSLPSLPGLLDSSP